MIEIARADQINEIAEIWLTSNIHGQDFIPAEYWNRHFKSVKEMLPAAEIYIYIDNNKIEGFIGIMDEKYIAGLFVLPTRQSHGIGRQLIEECQKRYPFLELDAYSKNSRAVHFYLKNGFQIISEKINDETNELEYRMVWKKE
ncbi:N-acetyltransferase [Methanimicrococcus blatticola]|uniref:Putative acetyltransferase n=1 Tax=Methanimicrococcus blatticola TaxID=91560 RepID=A0A484F6H0_9EURY|nr:N-acetyltransferase [Methanimicrococcus blatticola]MBZ3935543.1 N-acetyltransferase [Methanimicrococcus blatticola]MCC2509186.1 N-acetyltransferase [Methanimicrococcus blatticola]TDQ69448.1 putative acetyltransferase [Methanimicrococcus blatticola]